MKKNQTIDIPDWVKWAAVLLIGISLLKKIAPFLFKAIGFKAAAADIKENVSAKAVEEKIKDDPSKYKKPDGGIYSAQQADDDAAAIMHHLGLPRSIWPGTWYEDDKDVFDILKRQTKATFSILRNRYDVVNNRNLVRDLNDYLDSGYLVQVKSLWA